LYPTTSRLILFYFSYAANWNVEKIKIVRISKQTSPVQKKIDQNQLENVEYLNYLGSIITNNARCTSEITYRIATTEAIVNRKKNFSPANWTQGRN
jgi:hypothetical protein